ncbi:hypothetical protein RugamoR57_18720 [Duganella caerulea]|uniref:BrnT family toxin n=1 Tax=Duganella caerulea TaxID=2885762 RepID=UPI0030E8C776
MLYEWDEGKNQRNIKKHGVSFEDASAIFEHTTLTYFDPNAGHDEDRYIAIGLSGVRMLTVVFTERGDDTVRIISARRSSPSEEKRYERGY